MNIQTFKTHCLGCGNEVEHKVGNFTADNEIIVDFIEDMEFECECGTTTSVNVEFYESNY